VTLASSFSGLNHATGFGSEPPDTITAVGPNQIVELVNFGVAFYDKAGSLVGPGAAPNQVQSFQQFFGPAAPAGGSLGSFLYDPVVTYDDISDRFVLSVMDSPGSSYANFLDVAISNDSNPTDGFTFQRLSIQETSGTTTLRGDNERIGWNADAWVITSKMDSGFGSTTANFHSRLDVIYKSDFTDHSIDGPNTTSSTDLNFAITPATMHGATAGSPLWFVSSPAGGSSSIRVWELTNVLNDATRTLTAVKDVSVNAYGAPLNTSDPGGSVDTDVLDWTANASMRGNTLVSCLTAGNGTVNQAHWYEFDLTNPATPTKIKEGVINQGATTNTAYPGIEIAPNGDLGMSFSESSATEQVSMYVTGLTAAENTNETPVLVQAGQANYSGSRQGDYSGITVDATPLTVTAAASQSAVEGASTSLSLGAFTDYEGNFWGGNEFATNAAGSQNWGTEIAQFAMDSNGPWAVDVTWGDGSADTTFNVTATGSLGTQNHTYGEEGPDTVTVKVTNSLGVSDSKTFVVNVSDPAVVQASTVPVSAVEGAAFTGVAFATFTDLGGAEPNSSDPTGTLANHYQVASINWGDGTALDTSSGSINFSGSAGSTSDPFTVSGSHTYGEEGTYTITAVIDHEGVDTTLTSTATVSDPAVLGSAVPVIAVACRTLTVPVATYKDPGGAEPNASDPGPLANHYTATINWGDLTPTSAGTITFSGTPGSTTDPFTVTGMHAYATEGTYTITTTINHEGIITTVTSTATIKDDLGLLLLDPTGANSMMVTGNGIVDVTGCGAAVVDSNNASSAAFVTGNGAVTAEDIDVTGAAVTHGKGSFSAPIDQEAATPDPLGLVLPAAPAATFPAVNYSGSLPLTLEPGTYVGGIKITGKGAVTLDPGIYYMQGGGFSVTGKGSLMGTNVLIVNAPRGPSDKINFDGQASVTLTALTSGPDAGVTIFQDPASANPVSFAGQAALNLAGVIYAPKALVSIVGNANVTVNPGPGTVATFVPPEPSINGALIAFDLKVDGNGVLTINPDPAGSVMAAKNSAAAASLSGNSSQSDKAAHDFLFANYNPLLRQLTPSS